MAHLDNTYHYRVYDGEDKPLRLENADTAFEYAVENNAEKVVSIARAVGLEMDVSWVLALKWLKEQPEVPAILPDFIKRHLPPEAIELKRNQQLGRV